MAIFEQQQLLAVHIVERHSLVPRYSVALRNREQKRLQKQLLLERQTREGPAQLWQPALPPRFNNDLCMRLGIG